MPVGSLIGVGVPAWPEISGRWDLWPLVGIGLVIVVIRRGLGLRLGPLALSASLLGGIAFAAAEAAWGPTAACAVMAVVAGSLGLARRAAHRRTD